MNLITLREYAKHKDGTYVAFQMSADSKDLLDNFVAMNLGLTERVDKSTYHTTVIYSRTPVPAAEQFKGFHINTGRIVGYEMFPTKNDGKCLVARVECQAAVNLNNTLSALGATSDYPEYKPHLTLAYDTEQDIEIEALPIPQFTIEFNEVTVEPLDPVFVPKNNE